MSDERITSAPIHELRDTMLNPAYLPLFRAYLENVCGCACDVMGDESIVIRFPTGTLEDEYEGHSTTFRKETVIVLPNNVKLVKRVYALSHEGSRDLVALILPQKAFGREDVLIETWLP